MENYDKKIDNIGEKINKLSLERLNTMGMKESGLDSFYTGYVKNRPCWYYEYEKEIIKHIIKNCNISTKILECCAGPAHILIALSSEFNFTNLSANDLGTKRFPYANYIIDNLCFAKNKVKMMKKDFLDEEQTNFNDYDVILITNIAVQTVGDSIEEYIKFKKFLCNRSKEIILLSRCYGRTGFVVKKLFNDDDLNVTYVYKSENDDLNGDFHYNNSNSVISIKLK